MRVSYPEQDVWKGVLTPSISTMFLEGSGERLCNSDSSNIRSAEKGEGGANADGGVI